MPWTEIDVVDQRTEFILRVMRGTEPLIRLCKEFGITRRTGYKWKERFIAEGLPGLANQSRRPTRSPKEIGEATVCQIVKLRLAHPGWGARKLRTVLERTLTKKELPSESSFKRILERAGLIVHRRRKPKEQGTRVQTPVRAERPNQVWTIDFKGWWYTRERERFEPLTIRDDFSRYLLCAQAMHNARTETVQEQMVRIFERYGIPEVIRSDNGSPFAARGSPLGLSRLSAWWLTLGIDLDRIAPGRPDQNGGHERMHRDMAMEVEGSPEGNIATQQAALDIWRKSFNEERPHEALGMRVPSAVYRRSSRSFDSSPVELMYPKEHLVRKVTKGGTIKVHNVRIPLSVALQGWDIGLETVDTNRIAVWFCRLCIGEIDLQTGSFKAAAR